MPSCLNDPRANSYPTEFTIKLSDLSTNIFQCLSILILSQNSLTFYFNHEF